MNTISIEEHMKKESMYIEDIAEKFEYALSLSCILFEEYYHKKMPKLDEWINMKRLISAQFSMLEDIQEMFDAIKGGSPRLISRGYEIAQGAKAINEGFFGKTGEDPEQATE